MGKYLFYFITCFICIYSCNNPKPTFVATKNPHEFLVDTVNSEVFKSDTIPHEIINPSHVDLSIKNDTLLFTKGEELILTTYLKPDSIIDEERYRDEAFVRANCLFILRNVHYLGNFCHLPSAEKMEVYVEAKNGFIKSNIQNDINLSFLTNQHLLVKQGKWDVLLHEEAGDVYAFSIFKADGSISTYDIDFEYNFFDGYRYQGINQDSSAYLWTNDSMQFSIFENGKYQISELALPAQL